MDPQELDQQAQDILKANTTEEEKFDLLCQLAQYGSYPYAYSFINKFPLPIDHSIEMVRNLFIMGYHPDARTFYNHVGLSVYKYGSMYMKYVGIPYVPESVAEDNEAKQFVPYVINDLDKIIKQIIDATYNDADIGLRQGKLIGLKVLHGLYNLKADHLRGIFSFSRVKLDKEYIISFQLVNVPDRKKKRPGFPLVKLEDVKINLLEMDEPLSELMSLKNMMKPQDFYNCCAYRLALDDCTAIPSIPLDFVVSNNVFFGPFIEYMSFMKSEMVNYFKSLGYKEGQKLTSLKEQLLSVCEVIKNNMNRLTAVKNYFKTKYEFDIIAGRDITIKHQDKTYTLTLQGSLVKAECDNYTLMYLKDIMSEDNFNYSIAMNLIKGDKSVKVKDIKGFNPNYQLVYTKEDKGTYQGSIAEIMAFFAMPGIEDLDYNFICYRNGDFAKALLNGRNFSKYNIKYNVKDEDALRYKIYVKATK